MCVFANPMAHLAFGSWATSGDLSYDSHIWFQILFTLSIGGPKPPGIIDRRLNFSNETRSPKGGHKNIIFPPIYMTKWSLAETSDPRDDSDPLRDVRGTPRDLQGPPQGPPRHHHRHTRDPLGTPQGLPRDSPGPLRTHKAPPPAGTLQGRSGIPGTLEISPWGSQAGIPGAMETPKGQPGNSPETRHAPRLSRLSGQSMPGQLIDHVVGFGTARHHLESVWGA